jgi:sulfatase maturation enzyme AslB (radical SAM superfamily)
VRRNTTVVRRNITARAYERLQGSKKKQRGNLLTDDFDTIAQRVKTGKVYADIQADVRKCRETCTYFKMCGGIYENESANSTETAHCRAYQIEIDAVLDLIERIPRIEEGKAA